ncbi:PREDICTED: F-box protein At1g61340-like [Ipomoea nil]|uniref:F-box protein At1g61340-like n=1 Tax=Ipomoea nil TaxID=35883 RepID=UPI00090176E2|nr:PREDICTED: F-box protein At1g61340-like [Ipomoea nil]
MLEEIMSLEKKGEGIVKRQCFGRKRVVVSIPSGLQLELEEMDDLNTGGRGTETKKHCSCEMWLSPLESLPTDVVVRIILGVDHDDLSRLFHVSKTIREVTMIAKKWHFEYSTPTKTNHQLLDDDEDSVELEAPNAPRQTTRLPELRLSHKKLSSIAVVLFP